MGQKLPFNNVPSIFTVPKDPAAPRVFHRLLENPPQLWELHLWIGTNEAAVGAALDVKVTAAGAFIAQQTFPASGARAVAKVVDGVPVRGPLDLAIQYADGAAAPATPLVAFGYVQRSGSAERTSEKRFFDPGGDIGDQETSFEGGKGVLVGPVIAPTPQDIHQTMEDRIDEITLRANPPGGSGYTVEAEFDTSGGGTASEASVFLTLEDEGLTDLFDGIPFRDAGLLRAKQDGGEVRFALWSGYFRRS